MPNALTAVVPETFDQAYKLAELMARGKLVPDCLKGSIGDCFLVVEQAMRWGMSPFAVAQCVSSIHGKLMYEGKLIAAVINTSGMLDGRLDYEYAGQGDALTCTVTGSIGGVRKSVTVALKAARTSNKAWAEQPEQQLAYYGARFWARRWAPELMLGVPFVREDVVTIDGEAADAPDDKPAAWNLPPLAEPEAEPPSRARLTAEADKANAVAKDLVARFDKSTLLTFEALRVDPLVQKQRDWLDERRPELGQEVSLAASRAFSRLHEPPQENQE